MPIKLRNYLMLIMLMVCMSVFANLSTAETPVYTDAKSAIIVSADKAEFIIKMKSNPTTGYSWFLREYDSNLIEPVSRIYEAPKDKKLMGAPGYEVWTFKTKTAGFVVPQQTMIKLGYSRPWELVNTANQVTFWVTTVGK